MNDIDLKCEKSVCCTVYIGIQQLPASVRWNSIILISFASVINTVMI